MAHNIVVPLDGSGFAETALPTAIAVAKRWPARIHLVSIEQPMLPIRDLPFEIEAQRWAQDYLDDVRDRILDRTGLEVDTIVRDGPINPTIQSVARKLGADLLVVSTHGRGPLSRAWLGSVADALTRSSEVPVLLVRPTEGQPPDLAEDVAFARALIALDGSPLAESALEPATSLGHGWDVDYTVVRLVRYPNEAVSAYLPDTVRTVDEAVKQGTAEAEAYIARVVDRLAESGLRVESHVAVVNSVAKGILHHANESGADLIALASHGHGGFRRAVLGSVADKVVRGADRPVLVIRAPGG